jgi:sugar phosphate isomerase/epimerase
MRSARPRPAPTLSVCIGVLGPMATSEALRVLKDADIAGVELLGDPERYDVGSLLDDLSANSIVVTGLTAAARLSTGRDLSHPDPQVRDATVVHLRRCIAFAQRVCAPVVAVAPAAIGRHWLEGDRVEEWRWSVEGLRALAVDADKCGIKLGIEILNRYAAPIVNTVEAALELAEAAGGGPIGIVVDTFHSAIEESSLAGAIRDAGANLVNLQIADSNRQAPGRGALDFNALSSALAAIDYRGAISLEAFPAGCGAFPEVSPRELPEAISYVREFRSFVAGLPYAVKHGQSHADPNPHNESLRSELS